MGIYPEIPRDIEVHERCHIHVYLVQSTISDEGASSEETEVARIHVLTQVADRLKGIAFVTEDMANTNEVSPLLAAMEPIEGCEVDAGVCAGGLIVAATTMLSWADLDPPPEEDG